MYHPAANDTMPEIPSAPSAFHVLVQILLYGLGLFIQIKNISICIAEKSKTWQIDIFHAIVMTISFACRIPFMAVVYLSPDSFLSIGSWICYIFAFEFTFAFHSINSHSLIIAIMKYVYIVHAMKARMFGENKIKTIFFFINLALPLILTIDFMITSDFHRSGNLQTCFNPRIEKDASYNVEPAFFYTFGNIIGELKHQETAVFYLQLALGIFQTLVTLLTGSNLVEALFYLMIFKTMKRLVSDKN